MSGNKPPRKKKQHRAAKLKMLHSAKKKKNSVMIELHQADAQCIVALKATLAFTPFFNNKELIDAGDTESIVDNATILSSDVILLKEELNNIRKSTPIHIDPDDPEQLMIGLQIGARYADWIEKYERTVAVTSELLKDLFEDANKALTPMEGELM